jgi:hypothetical protein
MKLKIDAGTKAPCRAAHRFWGVEPYNPFMDSDIRGGWSKRAMKGGDVTIRATSPADAWEIGSLIVLLAQQFMFAGPQRNRERSHANGPN